MGRVANGRREAAAILTLWAFVLWFLVPHGIGTSWRECDTQAIARNFVLDDFDVTRPRVDWRGTTDGAVECEFPLYQLAIGAVLTIAGIDAEWPGRLFSLLAMVIGAFALHRLLERRAGPEGAVAGLAVFLVTGSAIMLGARVMPDAASFAFGMSGMLVFDTWLRRGRLGDLVLATVLVAIAALQKPLALQLGIVMFGLVCASTPRRLRGSAPWVAWLVIAGSVGAWLWHAASLHLETGLTFGVVSGGDSKFPDVRHLLDPTSLARMFTTSAVYGCSVFGALGLAVAVWRRRLQLADLSWFVAVTCGLLVSFRYSHDHGLGPHYHLFGAVAGALFVAIAWPRNVPPWAWMLLGLAVAAHGAWRLREERGVRNVVRESPIVAAAAAARACTPEGSLVIARSDKPRLDAEWGRPQNFEDPRFLYQARRRGFVLPCDEFDIQSIERAVRAGAVAVFDPLPATTTPPVTAWLAAHGERLFDRDGVVVWRLRRVN